MKEYAVHGWSTSTTHSAAPSRKHAAPEALTATRPRMPVRFRGEEATVRARMFIHEAASHVQPTATAHAHVTHSIRTEPPCAGMFACLTASKMLACWRMRMPGIALAQVQ
eukprot:4850636-Pleurochrysis_carterae.AAC.7